MSPLWTFAFLLLGVLCFVLAAFNVTVRRVTLVALGLFFVYLPALWAAGVALD